MPSSSAAIEWESPGQDGYSFCATRIVPLGSAEVFQRGRLEVDGEVFDVTVREDLPGQHDVRGLSGNNAGYGFSSRRSDFQLGTRDQGVRVDPWFLAQVDPISGYIE